MVACCMAEQFYVYIMASERNGTLYVGMTNNLVRRVYEHREGLIDGFTKQYDVKRLVYYEVQEGPTEAIRREKRIKHYVRKWKLNLIERKNPEWRDLWEDIAEPF